MIDLNTLIPANPGFTLGRRHWHQQSRANLRLWHVAQRPHSCPAAKSCHKWPMTSEKVMLGIFSHRISARFGLEYKFLTSRINGISIDAAELLMIGDST